MKKIFNIVVLLCFFVQYIFSSVLSAWVDFRVSEEKLDIVNTIEQTSDLSINLLTNAKSISEWRTIEYVINVKNNGPYWAESVVLSLNLDETFVLTSDFDSLDKTDKMWTEINLWFIEKWETKRISFSWFYLELWEDRSWTHMATVKSETIDPNFENNKIKHTIDVWWIVLTQQTVSCDATTLPANTQEITNTVLQTWNGIERMPDNIYEYGSGSNWCYFECEMNYSRDGDSCEANEQTVSCDVTTLPANTEAITNTVLQIWNGTIWLPDNIYEYGSGSNWCYFECEMNYSRDGDSCEADEQTVECNTNNLDLQAVLFGNLNITQNRNDINRSPLNYPFYNTISQPNQCNYTCKENYSRVDTDTLKSRGYFLQDGACFITKDKNLECFGENYYWALDSYYGWDVVDFWVGRYHTCILQENWNVYCQWDNEYWQADSYNGEYGKGIKLYTDGYFNVVLTEDGNVVKWWAAPNIYNYLEWDAIDFDYYSEIYPWTFCILRNNGNVRCAWEDVYSWFNKHNAEQIIVWPWSSCIITKDKNVECIWNYYHYYEWLASSYEWGDVVEVKVSTDFSCVLTEDQNIECWGLNHNNWVYEWYHWWDVVKFELTEDVGCALKSDGNVSCWGDEAQSIVWYTWANAIDLQVEEHGHVEHYCVLTDGGNVSCRWNSPFGVANGYTGGDAIQLDIERIMGCVLTIDGNSHCWNSDLSWYDQDLYNYTGWQAETRLFSCEPEQHIVDCSIISLPINSIPLNIEIFQQRNGISRTPSNQYVYYNSGDIDQCYYTCQEWAIRNGSECEADTQITSCDIETLPQNTTATTTEVLQTRFGDRREPPAIYVYGSGENGCYFECDDDFIWEIWDNFQVSPFNACILNDDGNVYCRWSEYYDRTKWYTGEDALTFNISDSAWCALLENGNVECRGYNYNGSYQMENYYDQNAKKIKLWWSMFACVVTDENTINCRGYDQYNYWYLTPYQWNDVIDISLGYSYWCALLENGNVECRWSNNAGQSNGYDWWDAIYLEVWDTTSCIITTEWNVNCRWKNNKWQGTPYQGGNAIDIEFWTELRCILLDNGNVQCEWDDSNGQLQWYTWWNAVDISMYDRTTCVLTQDGNVNCRWNNFHWSTDGYQGWDAIQFWVNNSMGCVLKSNNTVSCRWVYDREDVYNWNDVATTIWECISSD